MTYEFNEIGFQELEKRRKENKRLFYIFPIFFMIYIILTYISMRGSTFFWFAFSLLFILYVFIGIFSPINAAKRFNNVITKLSFEVNEQLKIRTEKVNFKKGKIFEINNSDIKSIDEKKIAYGSGLANGLLIRLYTNEEFFLIEKFYNEFKVIRIQLKNRINTGVNTQ